jgi:hypothetical protein
MSRTLIPPAKHWYVQNNSVLQYRNASSAAPFEITVYRNFTGVSSTVNYSVIGVTDSPAVATDFVGNVLPSGTITLGVGVASYVISIPVKAMTNGPLNKTFKVAISTPSVGSITFPYEAYCIMAQGADGSGGGTTAPYAIDTHIAYSVPGASASFLINYFAISETSGPVNDVTVTIFDAVGDLAEIYEDAEATLPITGSVVTTDVYGNAQFYTSEGTYLQVAMDSAGNIVRETLVVAVPPLQPTGDGSQLQVYAEGTTAVFTLAEQIAREVWIEYFRDYVSGSGDTEDWAPAIQRFHDVFATTGNEFLLRCCSRTYRLASGVSVTHSFAIVGEGYEEGPKDGQGTWFKIDTQDFTPFYLTGLDSRGFLAKSVAFIQTHPEIPEGATPWEPTPYAFLFDVKNTYGTVALENVYLCAIYDVMRARLAGRVQFRGKVWGQVFHSVLDVDKAYDVTHLNADIHIWNFWSSNAKVLTWQKANSQPFYFKRCDSVHANNIFVYGHRCAIRVGGSATEGANLGGTITKLEIDCLSSDSTNVGLWIDDTANTSQGVFFPPTVHIDRALLNCDGITGNTPAIGDSYGLKIEANNCRLYFGSLQIDMAAQEAITISGISNIIYAAQIELYRCVRSEDGSSYFDLGTSVIGPNKLHYDTLFASGGTPANGPYLKPGNGGAIVANIQADIAVDKDVEPRFGWGKAGAASATLSLSTPGDNADFSISAKGTGHIYLEKVVNAQESVNVSARTGQTSAYVAIAPTDGGGSGALAQATAGNTSLTNNYSAGNLDLSQVGSGLIRFNVDGAVQAYVDTSGVHVGDGNYVARISSGNPLLQFDTNDYIQYDRTNNQFNFFINSINVGSITAGGFSVPSGTVTSVGLSAPTGFAVSNSPVTSSGTLTLSFDTGYSLPTNAAQTNWTTAYNQTRQWDGGSTGLVPSTGRTSLGATTVGNALFTMTNPSAVRFLRINADNTVTPLDAAAMRTALGLGTAATMNISSGTAAPTGGADGDIYLQYA